MTAPFASFGIELDPAGIVRGVQASAVALARLQESGKRAEDAIAALVDRTMAAELAMRTAATGADRWAAGMARLGQMQAATQAEAALAALGATASASGGQVEGLVGRTAALGAAGEHATGGLYHMRFALTSMAAEALGVDRRVALLGSNLLMLGVGGAVTVGLVAGAAAIAFAWDKLTESSRKAEEAHRKLVAEIGKAAAQELPEAVHAEQRYQAALEDVTRAADAQRMTLERLRAERAQGAIGAAVSAEAGGAGVPTLGTGPTREQQQAQGLASGQQAMTRFNELVARAGALRDALAAGLGSPALRREAAITIQVLGDFSKAAEGADIALRSMAAGAAADLTKALGSMVAMAKQWDSLVVARFKAQGNERGALTAQARLDFPGASPATIKGLVDYQLRTEATTKAVAAQKALVERLTGAYTELTTGGLGPAVKRMAEADAWLKKTGLAMDAAKVREYLGVIERIGVEEAQRAADEANRSVHDQQIAQYNNRIDAIAREITILQTDTTAWTTAEAVLRKIAELRRGAGAEQLQELDVLEAQATAWQRWGNEADAAAKKAAQAAAAAAEAFDVYKQAGKEAVKGVEDAFATFYETLFTDGIKSIESFFSSIFKLLARLAAQMLAFQTMQATGGFWKFLFGLGTGAATAAATGGGVSNYGGQASFPAGSPQAGGGFIPRGFATGGYVGGEMPILAQPGERILSKAESAGLSRMADSSGGPNVVIHMAPVFHLASLDPRTHAQLLQQQVGTIVGLVVSSLQDVPSFRRMAYAR